MSTQHTNAAPHPGRAGGQADRAQKGTGGMAAASAASGMGLAVLGKRAGTAREYGGRNLAVGAVLGEGRVRGLSKHAAGRPTGFGGFLGGLPSGSSLVESALGLKGAGETRPSPARDMHVAASGSRAGSYLLHGPDHAAKDPARRIRPYPDFRVGGVFRPQHGVSAALLPEEAAQDDPFAGDVHGEQFAACGAGGVGIDADVCAAAGLGAAASLSISRTMIPSRAYGLGRAIFPVG